MKMATGRRPMRRMTPGRTATRHPQTLKEITHLTLRGLAGAPDQTKPQNQTKIGESLVTKSRKPISQLSSQESTPVNMLLLTATTTTPLFQQHKDIHVVIRLRLFISTSFLYITSPNTPLFHIYKIVPDQHTKFILSKVICTTQAGCKCS